MEKTKTIREIFSRRYIDIFGEQVSNANFLENASFASSAHKDSSQVFTIFKTSNCMHACISLTGKKEERKHKSSINAYGVDWGNEHLHYAFFMSLFTLNSVFFLLCLSGVCLLKNFPTHTQMHQYIVALIYIQHTINYPSNPFPNLVQRK